MNKTKKKHLFENLLLKSVSAISLIASALGGTLGTGVTRANADKVALVQRMTLTLTNAAVAVTDNGASGASGGLKIFDFAIGGVVVLAANCNLAISESGGIGTTATVNCGIGTVTAAADATLSSTEQNVIPTTAVVLSGSAGTFAAQSTAAAWIDGHTTAGALFLNMAVSDADSASNDTVTVNGTVDVFFIHLGDFA